MADENVLNTWTFWTLYLGLSICSSSFSAQGDVGPLPCVNRSRCLLPPNRITDTGLNWKERDRCCFRWRDRCCCRLCSVSDSCLHRACDQHGSPASEVSQRSPHLSITCRTLHLFRPTTPSWSSQQRSHDCLPAQYLFFIPLPFWLIQDHGCVAVCFTCLTDSSLTLVGSPTWLCHGFWILTALLTHLVTSDPSTWLSWPSVCRVSSVVLIIWSCWWAILLFVPHSDLFFYLYTCPTHHPFLVKLIFSISKSDVVCIHLFFPQNLSIACSTHQNWVI